MSDSLEERLAHEVDALDVRREAARVALGARLLLQYQEKTQELAHVVAQINAFLGDGGRPVEEVKSLADWAEEVLVESGGPRRYREIASEIHGRGFRHARTPKSPDQLADSVWTAMYDDSKKRFVKVGRGVWDLAARHQVEERTG
jgi:HB1/ASXL restriction endonuclease-like protein with HTH domain